MKLTIKFVDGPAPPDPMTIIVDEGESVRVGRRSDCELTITDAAISGRHCQIHNLADTPTVTDLKSRNGTLVNGKRIQQKTLQHGDQIMAGKSTFLVQLLDAKQPLEFEEGSRDGQVTSTQFHDGTDSATAHSIPEPADSNLEDPRESPLTFESLASSPHTHFSSSLWNDPDGWSGISLSEKAPVELDEHASGISGNSSIHWMPGGEPVSSPDAARPTETDALGPRSAVNATSTSAPIDPSISDQNSGRISDQDGDVHPPAQSHQSAANGQPPQPDTAGSSSAENKSQPDGSSNHNQSDSGRLGSKLVVLQYALPGGGSDELRIRIGQTVVVGASGSADLTLTHADLRQHHFQISNQRDGCEIERLHRRATLKVNHQAIGKQSRLYDGDQLVAGSCLFHVSIAGGERRPGTPTNTGSTSAAHLPNATPVGSQSSAAAALQTAVAAKPPTLGNAARGDSSGPLGRPVVMTVPDESFADAPTEVRGYQGLAQELPIESLLMAIARKYSLSMLIDPVRFGDPNHPDLILHQLASDEPGMVKTCWVEIKDKTSLKAWLARVWGKDCCVFLGSKHSPAELLDGLKSFSDPNERFLSVCWPSVISIMLASYHKDIVEQWFGLVQCVVSETASPRHWTLVCPPDREEELDFLPIKFSKPDESSLEPIR